jgi:hypothetical protein
MMTMTATKTGFFQTLIVAVFLLTANATTVLSQMGTTVLFHGMAIDEKTKSPIEVRYEISNTDGQKFRGKSMADGTFQQVLKPGQTYTISFMGKNIYRTPEVIALRASDKFYEEKRTFPVRRLAPGQQIEAMNLFKTGSAEMNSSEHDLLKKILSGVKNEDYPTISIAVANDLAVKGAKTKKVKKGKKAPADTIVKDRIAALNEIVSSMGEYVSRNVTIAAEKGKATANVSIKVVN